MSSRTLNDYQPDDFFQKLGAKIYIAVADLEAYNARGQSLEESKKSPKNIY